MTRGMGHLLRAPRSYSVKPKTRAQSGTTSSLSSPIVGHDDNASASDAHVSSRPMPPDPPVVTRVLRNRHRPIVQPSGQSIPVKRRPTKDRWYYESADRLPVPPVLLALSTTDPPAKRVRFDVALEVAKDDLIK